MYQCPKCGSAEIYRSRSRTWWDRCKKALTGKLFYRCHDCGWRGLGTDTGPKFGLDEIERANRAVTGVAPETDPAEPDEEDDDDRKTS
jgi:predicted RNA-binding Zn-ribbon protein involved in translation (DUF1610 family)